MKKLVFAILMSAAFCIPVAHAANNGRPEPVNLYVKAETWPATMHACAEKARSLIHTEHDIDNLIFKIFKDFPQQTDWFMQDAGDKYPQYFKLKTDDCVALEINLSGLVAKDMANNYSKKINMKQLSDVPTSLDRLEGYLELCKMRRPLRLKSLEQKSPKIVFTKHSNLGGSHYAYTEGLSDAQAERHFHPGTSLCMLEIKDGQVEITTLLDDRKGVIRDPDVSWDGKRILFSWKKSDRQDDYHLYEMDAETKQIRQLTDGLGYADYEAVYLPGGDILFNSTRCVQTVDCWWTEVSNLYRCDKDGKNILRISFDQVHTNYPQVLSDGRVIYTRWDYNDRGQVYPQPLFQMNSDGTAQTEFYGNNSLFPTTIAHARGIDGTSKVVCILTGHHSLQHGKLAIIDPSKGRQEAAGVQLIAPIRETKAVRIDSYGQHGEMFEHPYALNENEFIVSMSPFISRRGRYFGIYYITADGRRELLALDDHRTPCNQPVPLRQRKEPQLRASMVDYTKNTGTYYVQDIYIGPGLKGIDRGTVKEIRVVALDFRVAGIGENRSSGPAGAALSSTPPAIDNGTWDVKLVLGDAKVYEDGSAFFEVPARTPVYFQALDANGHVVQTMRSWSTLQPGEVFSCVGCHESKDVAPARGNKTLAMKVGPQKLDPFYGPTRGFSFQKEVQPIFDKHCIKCHDGTKGDKKAFSLLSTKVHDYRAKRYWTESYVNLTGNGHKRDLVNWINIQNSPAMLKPYSAGAAKSKLIKMLKEKHNKVQLTTEELEKIACWIDLLIPFCGDYKEANAWTENEMKKYDRFMQKRIDMQNLDKKSIENILKK